MARGINYSVRQMFPLTDGAGYKLFGANIYPHPLWWGFLRRNMNIQSGLYYHIKDTFFEEVQDSSLMANKEAGNYRPHYLAIQDSFPIQNAFPTTADYFDHIHTSKGVPLSLHASTAKLIADNLSYNLRLHKRGIPLFYTDIDRIYHLMEEKLKAGN